MISLAPPDFSTLPVNEVWLMKIKLTGYGNNNQ